MPISYHPTNKKPVKRRVFIVAGAGFEPATSGYEPHAVSSILYWLEDE